MKAPVFPTQPSLRPPRPTLGARGASARQPFTPHVHTALLSQGHVHLGDSIFSGSYSADGYSPPISVQQPSLPAILCPAPLIIPIPEPHPKTRTLEVPLHTGGFVRLECCCEGLPRWCERNDSNSNQPDNQTKRAGEGGRGCPNRREDMTPARDPPAYLA